jgi:hypothetical protein
MFGASASSQEVLEFELKTFDTLFIGLPVSATNYGVLLYLKICHERYLPHASHISACPVML